PYALQQRERMAEVPENLGKGPPHVRTRSVTGRPRGGGRPELRRKVLLAVAHVDPRAQNEHGGIAGTERARFRQETTELLPVLKDVVRPFDRDGRGQDRCRSGDATGKRA